MFYTHAWKVRKIQLIIVNAIFAVIGAYAGFEDKNLIEGAIIWLVGSWLAGTLIASFTKTGDKVSALAFTVGAAIFSGMAFSMFNGSTFWMIVFTWNMIKAFVGIAIILVILAFEFVIYPITTAYYFAKSRQESVIA